MPGEEEINLTSQVDQPPAEGLGSAALIEEGEQARQDRLTALNDDPTHPRGDLELAQVMARAGRDDRAIAIEDRGRASEEDDEAKAHKIREKAEYWSKRASPLEEWARILQLHPPNAAYKMEYLGFNFTPEGLGRTEELSGYRLEQVRKANEALKEFDEPDWGSQVLPLKLGSISRGGEVISAASDEGFRQHGEYHEKDRELATLLDNPSTTPEDLKELFKKRAEWEANYAQERIDETESILEDVRSGKAATYKSEENFGTETSSNGTES